MTSKEERIRAIDTAIERAGGIIRFAQVMGLSHQAVYKWKKRGSVPPDRAYAVEALLGVPRERMLDPKFAACLLPSAGAADIL